MYISVTGHYGTVYREIDNIGHGDYMAIMAHMVPLVLLLSYKNTFPNSYVFGICISPSQAIMALFIERYVLIMVTIWLSCSYGPTGLLSEVFFISPNCYVFGVCISPSQAIMALCDESFF